jgi:hypothetical protein
LPESAHPSKIFLKFMATNTISYLTAAVDIVRRYLPPGAQHRTALCAAIWLMGQCNVFVQNRELLAREPFSIAAVEREYPNKIGGCSRQAQSVVQFHSQANRENTSGYRQETLAGMS